MLGVEDMNFISASYNMYHNSIDITTFGYKFKLSFLALFLFKRKVSNIYVVYIFLFIEKIFR